MNSPARAHVVLAWGMAALACSAAQPAGSPPKPSFDELLGTIRTGNAYQRAEAIPPLSWIEDPRVVPELIALLQDEDATVRTYSSQQLARLADARSADALAEALRDPTGNVRRHAAEGLARVGQERHVPALVATVMRHLPDANAWSYDSYPSSAALEAIAKLSSKAPPELIRLMARVSGDGIAKGEAWWRLLAKVAWCLGRIGDRAAGGALLQAQAVLEADHQDYRAWYGVRKALAAISPQDMPFDRPAADILNEVWWGKGAPDASRPLAKLGASAMEDLAWMLYFEGRQDHERVVEALRALGGIGGDTAAEVLRDYVGRPVRPPAAEDPVHVSLARLGLDTQAQAREESLCQALAALLNATPDDATAHEVFLISHRLDDSRQVSLVAIISGTSGDTIPPEIRRAFLERVLLGSEQAGPLQKEAVVRAVHALGTMGGQRSGELLGKVLLESSDMHIATAASEALRTMTDYDAIPTLIGASKLPNTPKDAVAYAMGAIRDKRCVSVLRDMMRRTSLAQEDRLWVAAALARLGVDYESSARLIREALPASLDQARWLHDKETVTAVAALIRAGDRQTGIVARRGRFPNLPGFSSVSEHAISVLMTIGTENALEALIACVDLDTIDDAAYVVRVSMAAAELAEKLQHPAKEHWASVAAITRAVDGLFAVRLAQAQKPHEWTVQDLPEVIERDPALARRIWLAEVTRCLNETTSESPYWSAFELPVAALYGAERIFAPELIPSLERLARESQAAKDFHGKRAIVKHYYIRSLAAKILTDKTGQVHTFVDADGRTHPGGWDPSQDSE